MELAEVAGVSVGQVSNVRKTLLDREWAAVGPDGLRLTVPRALLDDWRDNYEAPPAYQETYYTTLHGGELENRLRALIRANPGTMMLAGFHGCQVLGAIWAQRYVARLC